MLNLISSTCYRLVYRILISASLNCLYRLHRLHCLNVIKIITRFRHSTNNKHQASIGNYFDINTWHIDSWQKSSKNGDTISQSSLIRILRIQRHWKPETLLYRFTVTEIELSSWLSWLMGKSKSKTTNFPRT